MCVGKQEVGGIGEGLSILTSRRLRLEIAWTCLLGDDCALPPPSLRPVGFMAVGAIVLRSMSRARICGGSSDFFLANHGIERNVLLRCSTYGSLALLSVSCTVVSLRVARTTALTVSHRRGTYSPFSGWSLAVSVVLFVRTDRW